MKPLFAVALLTVLTLSSFAKADGIQVCVDSKGSTYKVDVKGFAVRGSDFSGIVHATSKDAVPNGTDLNKIRLQGNLADVSNDQINDLAFDLKLAVAVSDEDLVNEAPMYGDEPRVYQTNGVDLVCSSTMSPEEFAKIR